MTINCSGEYFEFDPREWRCSECGGTGWRQVFQLHTWSGPNRKTVQVISREKYKELPAALHATSYDALHFVADAIHAGHTTGEAIAAYLATPLVTFRLRLNPDKPTAGPFADGHVNDSGDPNRHHATY